MNKFVILTGIFVLIVVLLISFSVSAKTNLSESLLRLHVIANSDLEVDQNIKLKVRDFVIGEIKELQTFETKAEVVGETEKRINNLIDSINQFLTENGVSYRANCYIGKTNFPTKQYGNIILPQGCYDSLIIELGEGVGQNWWCVLYPSLCFIDESSSYFAEESFNKIDKTIDKNVKNAVFINDSNVKIKFKLLELIKNWN